MLEGNTGASATYAEIKAYIQEKSGFSVSSLYIAEMKDKVGIKGLENYNHGSEGHRIPQCPKEKEYSILDHSSTLE